MKMFEWVITDIRTEKMKVPPIGELVIDLVNVSWNVFDINGDAKYGDRDYSFTWNICPNVQTAKEEAMMWALRELCVAHLHVDPDM